jgi:hypothetical protein
MRFNDIKMTVDTIGFNPANVNLCEVLKNLVDSGAVTIAEVFDAMKPMLDKLYMVNDVNITHDVYTTCCEMVKNGQIIQAIKEMRVANTGLGLKDAKEIIDELKIRMNYKPNF